MRGGLVILEGPDGAGKTTAAAAVASELRRRGVASEAVAFPGNMPGSLGHLVYQIHHEPQAVGLEAPPHAVGLQLLHVASHLDALYQLIRPAVASGAIIVMDRFWWSTIVYGEHAGLDVDTLRLLEQLSRHHWRGTPTYGGFLFLHHRVLEEPDPSWLALRASYESFVGRLHEVFPVSKIDPAASVSDVSMHIANVVLSRAPV